MNRKTIHHGIAAIMTSWLLGLWSPAVASQGVAATRTGSSRIKDIARIAGLESLDLIGYGIVVGLRGTGDKDLQLTRQTAANLMENFNISIRSEDISSMNVAACIVTASACSILLLLLRTHSYVCCCCCVNCCRGG